MAIVDANLVMGMPKSLCAFGGIDAADLRHEAYVVRAGQRVLRRSGAASPETAPKSICHPATRTAPTTRLPARRCTTPPPSPVSRSPTFSGRVSLHGLQAGCRVPHPHGLANALLISNVIRYNANDNPTGQTAFSQYDRPQARRRYAEVG